MFILRMVVELSYSNQAYEERIRMDFIDFEIVTFFFITHSERYYLQFGNIG